MSWLLKIVEGPMKGAEVALVTGLKVKVGSGDACDIVIADRSLEAVAFELDVTDAGVSCVSPSGETKTLTAYEVVACGTTAFAVGPQEGVWKPLVWPKSEPEKASAAAEPETSPSPEPEEAAEAEAAPAPRARRGLGCLVVVLLLILLGLALWFFWPRITEKYPVAESYRASLAAKAKVCWQATARTVGDGFARVKGKFEKPAPAPVVLPTLAEIAAEHGLDLVTVDGKQTLKGNCKRRTERLAIRALALASDPAAAFDLTDDESLRTAADELLFVVTEGSLKAVSASNRVVTVKGHVSDAVRFEKIVRALNADVPAIARLDTTQVRVGGGTTAPNAEESAADETQPEGVQAATPAIKPVARRDYPIAGILTAPYPCVVMRTGLRLTEGAQIGTAVIERIEADRLLLKDGRTCFEWRP